MQQRLPITRPLGEAHGAAGIPECQVVFDEMAAVKAGATPGGLTPAQADTSGGLTPGSSQDTDQAGDSQKPPEEREEQLGADECSP